MKNLLPLFQVIVSSFLIVLVLLQQGGGSALGSVFGDEGRFYSTRRGIQKIIFWLTIFFGFLFILLALLNLIV